MMEDFDLIHKEPVNGALVAIQRTRQTSNSIFMAFSQTRLSQLGDRLSSASLMTGLLSITAGAMWCSIAPAAALNHSMPVIQTSDRLGSSSFLLSQTFDNPGGFGLQVGDSGDAVAALQQRLADLGYYTGVVDGSFGSQTEAAVIQFQTANNLTADGIVGPATQAALDGAATPTTSTPSVETPVASDSGLLQLNTEGDRVIALQNRLSALGYYTGPISGYFGPQTEAAVIRFQQANGLTADGVVGPATESALGTAPSAETPISNPPLVTTPPPPAPSIPVVTTPPPSSPVAQEPFDQSEGRFSVIELQRRLQSQGFNPGPVDGVFGQQTRNAISEAQEDYGLSQSDILAP